MFLQIKFDIISYAMLWNHSQAGKARDCKSPTCGSNPHGSSKDAPVAQLDRVSDYESEGQVFESLRAHHHSKSSRVSAVW